MELLHSSKVRDVYADGDDVILVASDRVSVYDTVLPTPIPDKGAILTRLSLWWFEQLADIVPNHVLSAEDLPVDLPADLTGRAIRCRRLTMVPVECVARGYLTGSAWSAYRSSQSVTPSVSGQPLPPGLVEADRLSEAIFTPTTKAPPELGHDEPMTYQEVVEAEGAETAARLRDLTLAIYRRGAEIAERRGVLVADTKLEFGRDSAGTLMLGDEVLTPDSSRFWPAESWSPGRAPDSLDKQYVRDWVATSGWDRTDAAPELPERVVAETRARYIAIYERLTGEQWS